MKKFTLLFAFAFLASLIFGGMAFAQIAQRGSATSGTSTNTNLTINKPAGVVSGDVMLVNIVKENNGTDNPVLAGWTVVGGGAINGGDIRGTVLYKVAGGSEPASYTFALGASTNDAVGSIIAFSGVNVTGTPFDVIGTVALSGGTGGTATATGFNTTLANTAIVMFAQQSDNRNYSSWNTTSPGTLTEISEVEWSGGGDDLSVGAAWATKATIGATGNGTVNLEDNNDRWGAIMVALKAIVPPPTVTLTPAGVFNIPVGGSVNLTATANNYPGAGNYTFTWTAAGATPASLTPAVVIQAGNTNAKNLVYNAAGSYSVSVVITRGATVIGTNTVTVNVMANPGTANLWATSNNGTDISTFTVNGGVNFGGGPAFLFDPSFPNTTTGGTSTAALGRSDKPSIANGFFYWLPNTSGNNGVVEVYGANATGGSPTRIGSIDVNGGVTNNLGFVRLGMGPDGTAWILAGDNTTLYLVKFKPNGVVLNTALPVADRLVVVDGAVALTGGLVSTFQNGDICVAGDGNLVALANDGSGLTQIFTGQPNGTSTILAKKFDVLNQNAAPFTGSVNGVAFDIQGSLYVSTSTGLFFIDKNTVNGPASTISINQVWAGTGLQDLASNVFPTTIITPVKLGNFAVAKSGTNAILSWTTITESNSDHFEIERSLDGVNFTVVGTKQAAGSSSTEKSYQFVDPITVSSGIIYYRLRTVDIDANAAISKIVALRLNGALVSGFKVYPNPFTSDLKIQIISEKETTVTVRVNNALGQPVVSRRVVLQSGENIVVLASELATLKSGMYVMEVITDEGKMIEKIIKR